MIDLLIKFLTLAWSPDSLALSLKREKSCGAPPGAHREPQGYAGARSASEMQS